MKRFTFLPLMFTVWFTMSIINTASAGQESGLSIVFWFFVIFVVSCLIVIGITFRLIAFFEWLFESIQSKIKPKIKSLLGGLFALLLFFLLIVYVISVIVLLVVLLVNTFGVIWSSVIIFIVIFLLYMMTRDDDSINYPMPDLTALNPFEIAALRDGRKGIIQTALFNLCHLKERFMFKAIKEPYDPKFYNFSEKELFKNVANVTKCYLNDSPTQQPEGAIEDAIDQFAQNNQRLKTTDFFTDLSLRTTLDQLMEPINQKLRQMHLKTEKGKTTQLGDRYLNRLTEHFEWAKENNSSEIAPILLVAIYGIQNLEDSKDFSGFSLAFSNMTASGTESGGCGGCGGGCGGCGGCGGG